MFGFVLGTVSLAGLILVLSKGHHHWHSMHAGCCPGAQGKRRILFALYDYLEATPGQEKVIQGAVDSLIGKVHSRRDVHQAARGKLAQAFRSPSLDEGALAGAFEEHSVLHKELHQEFVVALKQVHEALDDRQRSRLAALIESGPCALAPSVLHRLWGRGAAGRSCACDTH